MKHLGISSVGFLLHLKPDVTQRLLGPKQQSPSFEERTAFCSSSDLERYIYTSDFWEQWRNIRQQKFKLDHPFTSLPIGVWGFIDGMLWGLSTCASTITRRLPQTQLFTAIDRQSKMSASWWRGLVKSSRRQYVQSAIYNKRNPYVFQAAAFSLF